MEFSEKEIEHFEILEEDEQEELNLKKNTKGRRWVGTWNNPSMTDEEFEKWFKDLEETGKLQYAIFQREKGENTGTIHFQFFMSFKDAQYFSKIKKDYLPQGCHFKQMYKMSTPERCIQYCSKEDTRVSGPYEIGEFIEERQRTDLARAIKMIDEGFSFKEISDIFQTQSLIYDKQFIAREQRVKMQKAKSECRNIEVTYVYGVRRQGKSKYVRKLHGMENIFTVGSKGDFIFDGYDYEDVILFDEFDGKIPIIDMNKYLDVYPLLLNIKGSKVPAMYTKIYLTSNYSLSELYKEQQENMLESYKAFCDRIHKIIRVDEKGEFHLEKETIWEDVPEDEVELKGWTRRQSKVIKYNKFGEAFTLYDRHEPIVNEQLMIPVDENDPINVLF
jgi:hypothetical protein